MWRRYEVTMSLEDKLMAGVPKNPEVIKAWLEARTPSESALAKRQTQGETITPLGELADQVAGEVYAPTSEEQEAKVWTGFLSNAHGLYVPGFHVKAHLKDCANILQKFLNIKALKAKLADRLHVVEPEIPLGKKEPAGYWEHPVHIMTMQGPRSALKRNDYVVKPVLVFHLRVLDDGVITEELLRQIFEYGSLHGFGAERGLGNGRYSFELVAESCSGEACREGEKRPKVLWFDGEI